jgi:hypothetical protein
VSMRVSQCIVRAVLGVGFLLLTACSSGPTAVPSTAPEATRPATGTATTPVTPRPATPAAVSPVDRLLREAADACASGDIDAGLARLDRALRVAPQRSALYLEMARCHSGAGDDPRAAAAAERGLSYCRGDECRRLRSFLSG